MKTKIRIIYTIVYLLMPPFVWFGFNNIPIALLIFLAMSILASIGKKMEVENNVRW